LEVVRVSCARRGVTTAYTERERGLGRRHARDAMRETHECRRSSTRFLAICTSSAERSSMLKVKPGAKTEPKSESSIARE
jgi:hypothetical protein